MSATAPTPDQIAAADRVYREARAERRRIRTLDAAERNRQQRERQLAERERWADPELMAKIEAARGVLRAAEQERDRVAAAVRVRLERRMRQDQRAAAHHKVDGPHPILRIVEDLIDGVASDTLMDAEYVAAEDVVREARYQLRAAQRAAERSARQREYERGQLERGVRLERRNPTARQRLELIRNGGRSDLELELELTRKVEAQRAKGNAA